MASIECEGVSFSYPLYDVPSRSLKVTTLRQVVGGKLAKDRGIAQVDVLRDVTFRLKSGDRLGIIGSNGAGKSTLLRLIAGLAYPQRGRLQIDGRVMSLIDKGLGINPELSGLANIELPLLLLGANDAEVAKAKNEIPEWTGLGEFINLPVRTYSEGMRARLTFALCTAMQREVLVLDEWIGAADAAFVRKAEARLRGFIDSTEVVVLSTHSMELVRHVCNVAMWLHQGQIQRIGTPDVVTQAYEAAVSGDLSQIPTAGDPAEVSLAAAV